MTFCAGLPYTQQSKKPEKKRKNQLVSAQNGERELERIDVPAVAQLTVKQIMSDQTAWSIRKTNQDWLGESNLLREKKRFIREILREAPAIPGMQYPTPAEEKTENLSNVIPQVAAQTLGISFDGATGPTETGTFPPDMQIGVGPTQIVVFVNGRLRTFNKSTGVADGVINVVPDVFFSSVITPVGTGETVETIYPHVRYDRISNRWFLNIIDSSITTATGEFSRPNRILLAVSDAVSNGTITASTVWTFYQFQGDATRYADYQSFGIDATALYIGANLNTLAGDFNNTKAWIIPKAPALSGSPLTIWVADNLLVEGAGPFAPQGVDNPDPNNSGATAVGYFIGVDNATFNTLIMRRITNPGSLSSAPTITGNISVVVNETQFPVLVPHLGNTGGINGSLDALDDRLSAAIIRNGRLWTAHNIGVNNTGTTANPLTRNAARWYELQNLNSTPTLVQSGTIFDNTIPNDNNQRNYWIPSIAVSGQGHAALGCSIAGANERVNAFITGRLAGDTPGTMREGPGGAALPGITNSTFAYNPPADVGGSFGRRWGNYSMTVVDPLNDMTMWTIQQYVNGTDTYGVRVAQLVAPPPATPTSSTPIDVPAGQTSINVIITGTTVNGSGFYDPGSNLPAPAQPFNHITASVSGTNLVVNSVTYSNPTSITLNLNTMGSEAGLRNVSVTNPDGQTRTGNNILNIVSSASLIISGTIIYGTTPVEQMPKFVAGVSVNAIGASSQTASTTSTGAYSLNNLIEGGNYTVTPTKTGDVNSISNLDASRIAQHIVGLTTLSANQLIAADTSGNGVVGALDAAYIAQFVASIPNPSITGTWKFLPASRSYPNVLTNQTNQNYSAVLVGEVTGNWNPTGVLQAEFLSTLSTEKVESRQAIEEVKNRQKNDDQTAVEAVKVTARSRAESGEQKTAEHLTIELAAKETTGEGILAYQFDLLYDAGQIAPQADACEIAETISRGMTAICGMSEPGVLKVAVFGTTPLTGEGTLLKLNFKTVETRGLTSGLGIKNFMFNESLPSAVTVRGQW